MSLVTLAEVREYLTLAAGVADTLLSTLITNYSGVVNNFCGRDFELANYFEELDVEGPTEQSVKLNNLPVVSVVALTNDGSLVDSDDYHVYRQGRISYEDEYFTEGFKKVLVSYVAGYTPVPADIKLATCKLIGIDYYTPARKKGFISERIGDYSYRRPGERDLQATQGFPADVYRTMMQYKRITG